MAEGGAPTIAEVRDAEANKIRAEAAEHPLVQAVIKAFPKAKITDIRTEAELEQEAAVDALPRDPVGKIQKRALREQYGEA